MGTFKMKKISIIPFALILVLAIFLAGCTVETDNNTTETQSNINQNELEESNQKSELVIEEDDITGTQLNNNEKSESITEIKDEITKNEEEIPEFVKLNLECESKKLFLDNLESFNIQETDLPEEIIDYINEKNSWDETFRDIIFPTQILFSNEKTFINTPLLIDSKRILKEKPNIIDLNWKTSASMYELVTLRIDKYNDESSAKEYFKEITEQIKKSQNNYKSDIGIVGDESISYYIKYDNYRYEIYNLVFRINNLVFKISEPRIDFKSKNILNSEENLKLIIEENFERICNQFK